MVLNIIVVLATFGMMEFVAWFTHKYIMHGLLWKVHFDHHRPHHGFFERNDLFFLIFAIPCALAFVFGNGENGFTFLYFIGVGIALYGLAYFVVHDVFIHQRFSFLKNSKNSYLLAIRKAHKIHHKYLSKAQGECFGLLIVPFKYFREAKAMNKQRMVSNPNES